MNRNSIEIHDSLEKSNSSSDFKDIIKGKIVFE